MNISLVLLAAGNSRRFEANKLLYLFRGKPMYRYLADTIKAIPEDLFYEKIAVTQYQEIKDDLDQEGYRVVINRHSELGISTSIRLALEAVGEQSQAVCFAVSDQPFLTAATMISFINQFNDSEKGIGCLCSMGELGNPAIFKKRYFAELSALQGDVGGRKVIRRHIDDLYLHEVADSMELVDIDEQHEVMP